MRYRVVINSIGRMLIIVGGTMIIPLFWAVYQNGPDVVPFIISLIITIISGLLMVKLSFTKENIRAREGFAIVALGWLAATFFGTLPYLLTGSLNFTDAFFETMSGLTTTGASVVKDVEILPAGLLMWRSLTQWLGGMGIILLFVAVLSHLGVGALQIFKAEVAGPTPEKIQPRVKETARILWAVYFVLTITQIVLLKVAGMTMFDSMAHTFTTVATGGFSTKNSSIGFYDSSLIQWIIILFMFLGGANFSLYFMAVKKKSLRVFWQNEEFKYYLLMVVGAVALVAANLYFLSNGNAYHILRNAAFQVVSIITTTGYTTVDYDQWPSFAKGVIIILMFLGGSTGSTAGGIKIGRYLVLGKLSLAELRHLIHPHGVSAIKINGKTVDENIKSNVLVFFFLYLLIFAIGFLVMVSLKLDIVSAASSVATTLGLIGPGLGTVGPAKNYAHIPDVGKYFLSLLMLIGRLEIYTVLVLISPKNWKRA